MQAMSSVIPGSEEPESGEANVILEEDIEDYMQT